MTKAEIILKLTTAKWLTTATQNIAQDDELARELYQFYFLTILQKPDAQIEKIYKEGYIQFWSIRILYLAIHGDRHPFTSSRIYDQDDVYLLELPNEVEVDREENEKIEFEKIHKIKKTTQDAYFYERELFKMWCSGMSARAINRKTTISVREILRVIDLMKKRCLEK